MLIGYEGAHAFSMSIFGGDEHLHKRPKEGGSPTAALRCRPPTSPRFFGIMNKERAMTKTLVALVLIAGGILLVTRVVDTEKPVPARLSPPTSVDQMSEARRLSPSM